MPLRASNFEFTDKVIHKVKTEGLRSGGDSAPIRFQDDFNSYPIGKLAVATGNVWVAHTGGV